jgi:ribosomal protein S5
MKVKYGGTILVLKPKGKNQGLVANIEMSRLARLFGFKDLIVKRWGRRHIRVIQLLAFQ